MRVEKQQFRRGEETRVQQKGGTKQLNCSRMELPDHHEPLLCELESKHSARNGQISHSRAPGQHSIEIPKHSIRPNVHSGEAERNRRPIRHFPSGRRENPGGFREDPAGTLTTCMCHDLSFTVHCTPRMCGQRALAVHSECLHRNLLVAPLGGENP